MRGWWVTIALVLAVVSCGSPTPVLDSGPRERSTARGLAAAVLAHVDHVTWYGGQDPADSSSDPSGISSMFASVKLADDSVNSLFVFVQHGVPDLGCQPDDGYQEVSCGEFEGGSLSVMRSRQPSPRTPVVEGRVMRPDGGAVLVEAFADAADRNVVSLVSALLMDPLVGWTTRAGTNEAGKRLHHFHTDSISVSTREVD